MNPLRAIVRSSQDGTFFEAQLLELNLAVSALSMDGVVSEIEHALVMEYFAAKHFGKVPFASLVREAPHSLQMWWMAEQESPGGLRKLCAPEEVLNALAEALHTPSPPLLATQKYSFAA
jgi:hypothetical protein